jgi:hypothetical protein
VFEAMNVLPPEQILFKEVYCCPFQVELVSYFALPTAAVYSVEELSK